MNRFPLASRKSLVLALTAFALYSLGAAATSAKDVKPTKNKQNLIVHEWGTFLCVQGSDGTTQGGMVDSEEALPTFVENRSNNGIWQRTQIFSKMETPVTYFYTDRPQRVQVRVDMPRGVLTHWYPMVSSFGPEPSGNRASGTGASFLNWRNVDLIPHRPQTTIQAGETVPTLWRVKADDPWRFARQTDSAFVKVFARSPTDYAACDYEKFLFYRGLGAFDLPLQIVSEADSQEASLLLHNRSAKPLNGLFAIWVGKDSLRFGKLGDLAGGASSNVATASALDHRYPLEQGVIQVKAAVAASLVSAGLYPLEAQAMVNTWEKSYFRTEGLRVLYILPRESVDAVIPIRINPVPDQLVRVMIGRVEVLTPEKERQLLKLVSEAGSKDAKVRHVALDTLAKLGRFQEPMLRRAAALSKDATTRAEAEALISKAAKR